jgi:hypothetical protein
MTGRIDDVDVGVAVIDRTVFGEDRDPALALEVIAVHHPFRKVLVLGEGAGLDQQLVDQRGLAVVDVGDDRDVALGSDRLGHERWPTRFLPRRKGRCE